MDEKDEIKSKLDLFANSILDIKCLSQEERDKLFEIEKDIILYMIKNKINISSDNEIIEKNVYSLVGIDLIGNRDFAELKLPEKTTLRRKLKEHMLSGKKFGIAKGHLVLERVFLGGNENGKINKRCRGSSIGTFWKG